MGISVVHSNHKQSTDSIRARLMLRFVFELELDLGVKVTRWENFNCPIQGWNSLTVPTQPSAKRGYAWGGPAYAERRYCQINAAKR